jgi:hypothetical protein
MDSTTPTDRHVGPPPHTVFHMGQLAPHPLPSGPTTPTGWHMDQPPPPVATWAGHPHLHRRPIIASKKVYTYGFKHKTYKVSNILLTTNLQFPLSLYSIFNIFILTSAMMTVPPSCNLLLVPRNKIILR